MAISITEPINLAFNRAKFITFQPFRLGKWFTVGFVAWLASLGEGGGANFPNVGGGGGPTPAPAPGPAPAPSPPGPFEDFGQWVSANLTIVIVVGVVGLLLIVALGLVLTWINSRGKFMFLDAIAHDTAEVVAPWKRFRDLGNSLFGFHVVLGLVALAAFALIGGLALLLAWPDIRREAWGGGATAAVIVAVLLFLPAAFIVVLIGWCTDNFIVHIMYARGSRVVPAWREFRHDVLRGNVGAFVLFLLMQIVLGIGFALGELLAGCVTCCLGFLPYLNCVVTLPLRVFMRAYPVYFLQQFGPQYVIVVESNPRAGGFPVIGLPPGTSDSAPIPPPLPWNG